MGSGEAEDLHRVQLLNVHQVCDAILVLWTKISVSTNLLKVHILAIPKEKDMKTVTQISFI